MILSVLRVKLEGYAKISSTYILKRPNGGLIIEEKVCIRYYYGSLEKNRCNLVLTHYELPDSSSVDFLNRMGVFWFTKFFTRIQKVIFYILREYPIQGTVAVAMKAAKLTATSTILDAALWEKKYSYMFKLDNVFETVFYPNILRLKNLM
jgi:hypothetical protein